MAIGKTADRITRLNEATQNLQRKLATAKAERNDALVLRIQQKLAEFKKSLGQLKAGKREFDVPAHASLPVGVDVKAVQE